MLFAAEAQTGRSPKGHFVDVCCETIQAAFHSTCHSHFIRSVPAIILCILPSAITVRSSELVPFFLAPALLAPVVITNYHIRGTQILSPAP